MLYFNIMKKWVHMDENDEYENKPQKNAYLYIGKAHVTKLWALSRKAKPY